MKKIISYCPNDPKLQIHFGNFAEDPSVLFSVAKSELLSCHHLRKSDFKNFYLIRMVSSLKIYTIFLGQLFLEQAVRNLFLPNQQTKKTKTNLFNCPVHCCYVLLYTLSHSNHFKEKEVLKTKQKKAHEKTVTYPQHIQSFLFMRHLRLSLKFLSVSDKNSFCE